MYRRTPQEQWSKHPAGFRRSAPPPGDYTITENQTMASILPPGFLVRPPTMDDLDAVTAMTNAGEIADFGMPETTVELVRTRWQAPNVDLVADNWLVVSPEGHVVGYAGMSD